MFEYGNDFFIYKIYNSAQMKLLPEFGNGEIGE